MENKILANISLEQNHITDTLTENHITDTLTENNIIDTLTENNIIDLLKDIHITDVLKNNQITNTNITDELLNQHNKIEHISNHINKTYKSDKIVLDIETDKYFNILQIAYNMYDINNKLIHSKDFYIYDGIHSKPFFPTINENDIIKNGLSLKEASDIITRDINNTTIIIGHNIKSFDLIHINKLNDKFNNKIKDTLIIHDTMISSKHIIEAKDKLGRLKNPRLDEMLMFLCNKSVENYHNALGDIIATFDCYKILCDKYKCFQ